MGKGKGGHYGELLKKVNLIYSSDHEMKLISYHSGWLILDMEM